MTAYLRLVADNTNCVEVKDRPERVSESPPDGPQPSAAQRAWLERGLDQAGGKLPLFDGEGRRVNGRTIKSCIKAGWAEPGFSNPIKPDWQVCKLTESGRLLLA